MLLKLHESPLYKLSSKRKLADLFGVSVSDLRFLLRMRNNYREWPLRQKRQDALAGLAPSPKVRIIQQPKPTLDAFQRRLAMLLSRLEKPDYVYSATKGRCYFKNALVHRAADPALKIDIRSFYPSVKKKAIKAFFEDKLKCAEDVAHLISELSCKDGNLATGSALSPALSYFACASMFDRISSIADERKLKFTLYVDDMVFSGSALNHGLLKDVVRELNLEGYVGHKFKFYGSKRPKVITGVAVWPRRTDVPHKRRAKMRAFEAALKRNRDPDHRRILAQALLGQYRESIRLNPSFKIAAARITRLIDASTNKLVKRKRTKRRSGRSSFRLLKLRMAELRATKAPPVETPSAPDLAVST